MSEDFTDVRQALSGLPHLKAGDAITRLGGLTNRVYRVGDLCVRLPGAGTEEYIDRRNEAVAAQEAARAGVSPAVLHADPVSGLMVTRFIDGTVTMSAENFRSRPGAPARAGQALARLHRSGATVSNWPRGKGRRSRTGRRAWRSSRHPRASKGFCRSLRPRKNVASIWS